MGDESPVTRTLPLFALADPPATVGRAGDPSAMAGNGDAASAAKAADETAGGGTEPMVVRVAVAGEQEDYAADLADELCAQLLPPTVPRPSRVLQLLGYLEVWR